MHNGELMDIVEAGVWVNEGQSSPTEEEHRAALGKAPRTCPWPASHLAECPLSPVAGTLYALWAANAAP